MTTNYPNCFLYISFMTKIIILLLLHLESQSTGLLILFVDNPSITSSMYLKYFQWAKYCKHRCPFSHSNIRSTSVARSVDFLLGIHVPSQVEDATSARSIWLLYSEALLCLHFYAWRREVCRHTKDGGPGYGRRTGIAMWDMKTMFSLLEPLEYTNVIELDLFTYIINKNKTNQPISSNSHPLATANKAIHSLKIGGGGLTKPTGTS